MPDESEQVTPPSDAIGDAPPANEAPSKRKWGGRQEGAGRPTKYGYRKMRRALSVLGTQRLDGRSAVAVAVRMLKEDIRRDMGSDLSRSQEVVLEAAARAWVIFSALDDFIARQSTLVNGRTKAVLPVIHTRMQVAEGLARNLERLSPGLERRAKDLDLAGELAELSRRRREPAKVEPQAEAVADAAPARAEPVRADAPTKTSGGQGPS